MSFDYLNSPILFWTALFAFVVAVLFELYMRTHIHVRAKRERPHPERIDRALAYFRKHKATKITNDIWQGTTKVSDATASRDLQKLVDLGVLKQRGSGRGIYYTFEKNKNASQEI